METGGFGEFVSISNCGGEQCAPGHTYGPAIRDHYLIHFVASGRGVLRTDDGEYKIEKGHGFVIFPDEITVYSADEKEPWAYDWVGFNGNGAEKLAIIAGLTRDRRVFRLDNPGSSQRMMQDISEDMAEAGNVAAVGALIRLLGRLGRGENGAQDMRTSRRHYDRARWYMDGHYAQPITVQDVADYVGLSRSQLFRVFDVCEGASPKEVLTSLRLRHACRLLAQTDLSLEDTAQQVGLTSAQRLGVMFRKNLGVPPGEYRKKNTK